MFELRDRAENIVSQAARPEGLNFQAVQREIRWGVYYRDSISSWIVASVAVPFEQEKGAAAYVCQLLTQSLSNGDFDNVKTYPFIKVRQ